MHRYGWLWEAGCEYKLCLGSLVNRFFGFLFFFPPPAGVSAHNVKKNSNDTLRAFFGDGREGFLETLLRNRPQTLHINAAGVEN